MTREKRKAMTLLRELEAADGATGAKSGGGAVTIFPNAEMSGGR